jgi:hypothetical protein
MISSVDRIIKELDKQDMSTTKARNIMSQNLMGRAHFENLYMDRKAALQPFLKRCLINFQVPLKAENFLTS